MEEESKKLKIEFEIKYPKDYRESLLNTIILNLCEIECAEENRLYYNDYSMREENEKQLNNLIDNIINHLECFKIKEI